MDNKNSLDGKNSIFFSFFKNAFFLYNLINKRKNIFFINWNCNYLDKKLEFTPNRGSWFSIPLETLKEAKTLLKDFKIEYTGSGEIVISQTPNAGERIPRGETIRILLE